MKSVTLYMGLVLYHFDSIFLITVTVFPTHFPQRNKRHNETNIIPYLQLLKIHGKNSLMVQIFRSFEA